MTHSKIHTPLEFTRVTNGLVLAKNNHVWLLITSHCQALEGQLSNYQISYHQAKDEALIKITALGRSGSIYLPRGYLFGLEEKLESMKAQATQLKSGTAAAGMLAFINQRLALLERMAKLIEHHRALQAAAGAHQQRLHNLQKKSRDPQMRRNSVSVMPQTGAEKFIFCCPRCTASDSKLFVRRRF